MMMMMICYKYGIKCLDMSFSRINDAPWNTFAYSLLLSKFLFSVLYLTVLHVFCVCFVLL